MLSFRKSDPLSTNFIAPTERTVSRQTILLAAAFSVVVALLSAAGATASYRASAHGTSILQEIQRLPLISHLERAAGIQNETPATPEVATHDRMNVLLLGVGGEGHEGSQLTDTIILASIDLKEKRVGLLSIPRDLAYPLGGGRFEKINAVNAYFEQDHPGEGAARTAQAFSTLLEQPIDHVIKIDFTGFGNFVDALDGIDVVVERTFTDYQYPTADKKWMTVTFKKGPQHMDGKTALIYARSRHGNNGEGSDFARSRRQQIVIMAVRQKLLSLGTLTDHRALANLYTAITNHIQTDFTPWNALALAPLLKDFSSDRINLQVLTDEPGKELVAANVNGAFMLFPKNPDWSEIRALAAEPFKTIAEASSTASTSTAVTNKPAAPEARPRIEVRNGTTRTGFAAQMAAKLEKSGYEVKAFGNAIRRGYEETVIFDLTQGKKPQELAKLKKSLQATVSLNQPDTVRPTDGLAAEKPINASEVDFFVILGEASYPLLNSPL
jgi:LCP family protein required for cell wall assembly